jgi:DDE superfamily endonuclease
VDLHESKLLWVNGPFPAGQNNDLVVFRKPGGLKSMIPPGALVIADKGYRGEDQLRTPNRHDSRQVSDFKTRARARHETFNKRIKSFKVLSQQFRHKVEKHKVAFEAVCVLTQYDVENGHPLFDIEI